MTKLEEVAKAIYKLTPDEVEERMSADAWRCRLRAARAAVEALRIPSQAQYDGLTAKNMMWRELNSTDVYVAMIDAVLNEKP